VRCGLPIARADEQRMRTAPRGRKVARVGERLMSRAVKVLANRSFRRASRRAIVGRERSLRSPERGRFTEADTERLLSASWRRYDALTADLPREPGIGPKMNVRLACATLAFYDQLLAEGCESEHAIELIGDAAWAIYQRWGVLARAIARLRSKDAAEQMRVAVDVFLRFPFSRPGYRYERFTTAQGAVAIDMHRCPVADYLAGHDARALCVGTWCNLDFALAELWGGRLERTETIASGCERCDFRFIAGTDRSFAGTSMTGSGKEVASRHGSRIEPRSAWV
jgi:L-2-amino-thiazoline-4-carboxylic acid hydrolase